MNKQEFLLNLREALSGLPKEDAEERLTFYREMIEDRVEDGSSEEAAVREIGSVAEVAAQIVAEIPLTKLVKERIKPGRRRPFWEIALLALGAPLWGSLLIAVLAVLLSLYAALWAVSVSLWAVFAAASVGGVSGAAMGVFFAASGYGLSGVAAISAGLVCAGLAVFLFFGCRAATKGIWILTKKPVIGLKHRFVGKGVA